VASISYQAVTLTSNQHVIISRKNKESWKIFFCTLLINIWLFTAFSNQWWYIEIPDWNSFWHHEKLVNSMSKRYLNEIGWFCILEKISKKHFFLCQLWRWILFLYLWILLTVLNSFESNNLICFPIIYFPWHVFFSDRVKTLSRSFLQNQFNKDKIGKDN
jgi:hypothetical protein